MLCFAMPTDLSFFRYEIWIFMYLLEFRRFAHRKHSQSDAGMNLAFFKFDRIIGWTIFIANTLLIKKTLKKRQLWIRPMGVISIYKIYWKMSAVSTTCLNGWNSILQAAWYIRHVRIIWFLWTKHTIWSLILSFTQNIVRACSMFYHEGYTLVGRWLPWMPGSNRTIVTILCTDTV